MSETITVPENWLLDIEEVQMLNSRKEIFKDEVALAYRVSNLSKIILDQIRPLLNSDQNLITICLFMRIYNSHKAAIREALFGFWTESDCIVRPMIEALIYLFENLENADFTKRYPLSQNELRRKLVLRSIEDQKEPEPKLLSVNLNSDLETILKEIKEVGDGDINQRNLAKKHNLHSLFDQIHAIYHNSVHVKPNSLARHFSLKDNSVTDIIIRPSSEYPKNDLSMPSLILAEAVRKFINHFKFEHLYKESDEMWKTMEQHGEKLNR